MNSNALMHKIVAEFRRLQEPSQQEFSQLPLTQKTQTVLATLCNLGNQLGYTARANVPEYQSEWLYDASWHHSDTSNRLTSVPMVAESEWGNIKKIEEDFQKLLLARSAVRVMVYDAWQDEDGRESAEAINNKLCEHVRTFNGAPGDTYLLIAYGDSGKPRFKFSTVIVQAPGEVSAGELSA